MKKALRQLIVVMVLAVALYGGYAVWSGIGKLGESLSHFTAWSFAAACALAFCNYVVRFGKWEFYLARLGIRGVSKSDSFLTFLSGFVLTVTPGKVGEVFKSLVLFETHGVPIPLTAPIVVAERVTDLIGIITLIVLGSLGFSGGPIWAAVWAQRWSRCCAPRGHRVPSPVDRDDSGWSSGCPGSSVEARAQSPRGGREPGHAARSPGTRRADRAVDRRVVVRVPGRAGSSCAASARRPASTLAAFFYATSTLAGALVPVPGGLGITESALKEQLQTLATCRPATSTAAMMPCTRFATPGFAVLVASSRSACSARALPAAPRRDRAEPRQGLGGDGAGAWSCAVPGYESPDPESVTGRREDGKVEESVSCRRPFLRRVS